MMSIVAMARPAPFTKQAMSPSRATYWRSKSLASASRGSSSHGSRIAAIRGCRKSALSSNVILASSARTRPESVIASGLISASERNTPTPSPPPPVPLLPAADQTYGTTASGERCQNQREPSPELTALTGENVAVTTAGDQAGDQ